MGSLIVYLLVALEELSQVWVLLRNADIYDLIFGIAGIHLFVRLALWNLNMRDSDKDTD